MVGLAGIAQALREIVWPDAVPIDARYPGDRCHVVAFGGAAEVLKLVQAEWPMLAIDKDVIEVELPQNVGHPWRWEGEAVTVGLAAGTHGGFDSVRLLHRMSSHTRRMRSDHQILSPATPAALS